MSEWVASMRTFCRSDLFKIRRKSEKIGVILVLIEAGMRFRALFGGAFANQAFLLFMAKGRRPWRDVSMQSVDCLFAKARQSGHCDCPCMVHHAA